ncbi:MAG TPA: hypothetical protein DEB06_08705 [Phycisphaerales bacterium]|nr:hypothetical protein [Phycisphaerales bacterium]
MNRCVLLGVMVVAGSASSALAGGDFLVRRASAVDLFVGGTSRSTGLQFNGGGPTSIETGTFNLEKSADGGMTYESFHTYCVEVGKPAPPVMPIAYDIRPLSDKFSASETTALRIIWDNAFDLSDNNAINAAAFQAIVWEFAQDDSFNLVPGLGQQFNLAQAENAVRDLANLWFANVGNATWTTEANLILLASNELAPGSQLDYQDLLMEMPREIIPLPTAGLMASVGLLGLASVRRRTK